MSQTTLNLNTAEETRKIARTAKAVDNATHLARLAAAMAPDLGAWEYQGEVSDGKGANAKCTCGHPIRWIYLIRHKDTAKALPIGSTCIKASVPLLIESGAAHLAEQLTAAVEAHEKAIRDAKTAERRRVREIAQDEDLGQLHTDWAALLEWRRTARRAHVGGFMPWALYRGLAVPKPTKTKAGTINRLVREYRRAVARFTSDGHHPPAPTSSKLQPEKS
jgi:hypothetical protein